MYKYRPELMQARMNAMGQMSHAFEPMNAMMGQAYGPQAQFDIQSMIKNPYSPEAIARMNQEANPQPKQKTGMGKQQALNNSGAMGASAFFRGR